MLHPEKHETIKILHAGILNFVYTAYKKINQNVNQKLLHEFASIEIKIPPLADELMRIAEINGISLIDAALCLNQESEIIELRKIIWKMNKNSSIRLEKVIQSEADDIAKSIKSRISSDSRISRKTVDVSVIPSIGSVFKFVGIQNFELWDYILSERPYMPLYSRWAGGGK